jgi:hypothetical protein
MTKSERDLLMPFLRKLVQTRNTPCDDAAITLIRTALAKQPNASYLLVQRALTLECELSAARRRIEQLEGKAPLGDAALPEADFINPATSIWGVDGGRNGPVSSSKRIYDFFKQGHSNREMDLESRAIAFLEKNSVKVWLFILALTVVVVFFNEKVL